MYQTTTQTDPVTIGEARSLAAMALSEPTENVEAYAVIGFVHRDREHHELIVMSDIAGHTDVLLAFLNLVIGTSETVKSRGPHLKDNQKSIKLITRFTRSPWSRRG